MITGSPVNVLDYGADPTGVADSQPAIQEAIDYAIYFGRCDVYIPGGKYRIDKPIQVGYGAMGGSVTSTLSSVTIHGAGFKFRTATPFAGTGIIPTFSNGPAFNVQACRHTVIKGLGILGLYYTYALNNDLGGLNPAFNDVPASAWVDSSLASNAFSRYAPYAGISVDGYSGTAPALPYPNITYPAFLGAQTQYGKTGISSEIVLEDLYIGGFAVGVVVEPNGTDGQGEFLKLNRCLIEFCQYGVSVGQTQARVFDINSCYISNVHTALITNVNGLQNGMPCFSVRATGLDRLINVMNISTSSLGGPTIFEGCYGEAIYSLGFFGTTASVTCAMNMIGCTWGFLKQAGVGTYAGAGAPQAMLSNPGSNSIVNIDGCWFADFIGNLIFDTTKLTFTGCNLYTNEWSTFRSGGAGLPVPVFNAFPLKSYGLVQTSTYGYFNGLYSVNGYSVVDGTVDAGATTLSNRSYSSRTIPLYRFSDTIYSATTQLNGGRDPGIANPLNTYDFVLGSASYTISMSGRTATITTTSVFTDDQYNVRGLNPGDIINYTTPTGKIYTFYIRARTAAVITAMLQNGFDGSGNALATLDNTATLYSFSGRYYLCNNFQLGTFTAASANITTVGDSSGTFSFDGVVDDAFLADAITDSFAATTNTRITVIASPTITMNGVATQTITRRLPILNRKAPPNA
jgi:hypothetical protein